VQSEIKKIGIEVPVAETSVTTFGIERLVLVGSTLI
jgi:hypothetical protein